MAANVTVSLNGPTFSSLYYELANCSGDQEGFLLGEVKKHTTDVIDDSEIANSKEETVISLTSVIPCERVHCFYGNNGEMLENNVNALIGDRLKDVVGWYRFRRNTGGEPMMLEQRLHRHLTRWCCQHHPSSRHPRQEQFFLFGIFTSSVSANLATHSFDHSFFRFTGREFEGLTCTVINLGDTSESEYKCQSHLLLPVYFEVVDRLVQESNAFPGSANTAIAQISGIHGALESNLKGLYTVVSKDEALVRKLRREVELMKNQLRIRESAAASPATPGTPDLEGLWLNSPSPVSTTNSSGFGRSSSARFSSTSAVNQPFASAPRNVAIGRRQTPTATLDTKDSNNKMASRQSSGHSKDAAEYFSGTTNLTGDYGVGAAVQSSVFGVLPAFGQNTSTQQSNMVFGCSQSSNASKHSVPQVVGLTGYHSSEVPELLSSRRETNPFIMGSRCGNDDSLDIDDGQTRIGKR